MTSLSVRLTPFDLALSSPLEAAGTSLRRRRGVLVQISDQHRRGLGEATPLPGWTESLEETRRSLRAHEPTATEDELRGKLEGRSDRPAARHGLQQAHLDLIARRSNVPMYRKLGGDEAVRRVPVNGVVGDAGPQTTAGEVRRLRDEGFSTVKVKVGARPVPDDRRRLEALAQLDPPVSLRLDANGAWDVPDVRALGPNLEKLPLDYLEQPLPPGNLTAHAELRKTLPVALDESLLHATPEAILEHGAADAVVIKPMVSGGLDRARERAMTFHRGGVTPVVGGTVDAAVARLGALHLAASLPVRPPAGLATGDRLESDVLSRPPRPREGHLPVPRGPGLGDLGDPAVEGTK